MKQIAGILQGEGLGEFNIENDAESPRPDSVQRGEIDRSDVHHLYQDFYITDLKQEVQDAQKIATQYRKETAGLENELERLKKENADLKGQVKRYRLMFVQQEKRIAELSNQPAKATVTHPSTNLTPQFNLSRGRTPH